MKAIQNAFLIACNALRSCYKDGILAGMHHFDDYWARDSFFAGLGCMEIKDYEIVKKNMTLFISYMSREGQIPLRVGKNTAEIFLSFIGVKGWRRKPIYTIDKSRCPPVDQNSLLLACASEYMKKTHDKKFLSENIEKLEKTMDWNLLNDSDNDLLIEEAEYSNWADSIRKRGTVLYTNVCHCHAIRCLSELFMIAGNKKNGAYYNNLFEKTKERINDVFWRGNHYIDWIDESKEYDYFSTDGNMLAVLWGIADNAMAKQIVQCSDSFGINDVPSGCVYPPYPSFLVSKEIRLIGLKDYHNGLSWLWLGAICALAKNMLGKEEEAKNILGKISNMICRDNDVFEVYEKKGMPVRRGIYKAEHPFAWNAGMFVYACRKIYGLRIYEKHKIF